MDTCDRARKRFPQFDVPVSVIRSLRWCLSAGSGAWSTRPLRTSAATTPLRSPVRRRACTRGCVGSSVPRSRAGKSRTTGWGQCRMGAPSWPGWPGSTSSPARRPKALMDRWNVGPHLRTTDERLRIAQHGRHWGSWEARPRGRRRVRFLGMRERVCTEHERPVRRRRHPIGTLAVEVARPVRFTSRSVI